MPCLQISWFRSSAAVHFSECTSIYNPFSGKKLKKTMYSKKSVPFKVFFLNIVTEDVCTTQVNDVNMDVKTLIFAMCPHGSSSGG